MKSNKIKYTKQTKN